MNTYQTPVECNGEQRRIAIRRIKFYINMGLLTLFTAATLAYFSIFAALMIGYSYLFHWLAGYHIPFEIDKYPSVLLVIAGWICALITIQSACLFLFGEKE